MTPTPAGVLAFLSLTEKKHALQAAFYEAFSAGDRARAGAAMLRLEAVGEEWCAVGDALVSGLGAQADAAQRAGDLPRSEAILGALRLMDRADAPGRAMDASTDLPENSDDHGGKTSAW